MTTVSLSDQWVKILSKGLITIPKNYREELNLKEGEVARVRLLGKRLIIEPRQYVDNYEEYSNKEFKQMLEDDKLPPKLAKKAFSFWPDLK